jgi:hypothetical protein
MADKPADPIRDALATQKLDIENLSAETLALRTVFVALCFSLMRHDETMRGSISNAFDAAARFVEDVAIRHGKSASPEHTVNAIRIVEELRAAILGDKTKPRHGV